MSEAPQLHLEGFDGPLDLLLELARGQKVDLARISILSLVDQYLAIVQGVRLELAADWLVMAAWLAWLKSRLLLPAGTAEALEAEVAAEVLTGRLRDLQVLRAVAVELAGRPQLGHEVFARGAPERLMAFDRSRLAADLPGLLHEYIQAVRRRAGQRQYRPERMAFWTVGDALVRIERLLGARTGWTGLLDAVPGGDATPVQRRAALASTLLAGLELVRGGVAEMRQAEPFGHIFLRARA